MMISCKILFVFLIGLLSFTGLSACSSTENSDLHMMPLDDMPMEVKSAPVTVQQAYQFASANPDVTQHIPCYCGCGDIGHTSNYSCYVSHVDEKGAITFDNHAMGCSLCVDITLDAMRLTKEGKSPPEIKAYVDVTYSKYGTTNMP